MFTILMSLAVVYLALFFILCRVGYMYWSLSICWCFYFNQLNVYFNHDVADFRKAKRLCVRSDQFFCLFISRITRTVEDGYWRSFQSITYRTGRNELLTFGSESDHIPDPECDWSAHRHVIESENSIECLSSVHRLGSSIKTSARSGYGPMRTKADKGVDFTEFCLRPFVN